jgi:hypothetical protein
LEKADLIYKHEAAHFIISVKNRLFRRLDPDNSTSKFHRLISIAITLSPKGQTDLPVAEHLN